jgi:hypothetical protein
MGYFFWHSGLQRIEMQQGLRYEQKNLINTSLSSVMEFGNR